MSHDLLLTSPTRGDLGLVGDLVDAATMRLKTALVKRCGCEVAVRPDPPTVRQLKDLLHPVDELAIGAAASFTLSAGNLRGLVTLDVPLVQRLVGLFLGESPNGTDPMSGRPLTRLDLQLAYWICDDIVQSIVEACMVTRMTAKVGDVHTNPRSVTALPQSQAVVEVELELGPEEMPYGRATVVLPAQAAGVLWPERQRPTAKRNKPRTRSMAQVRGLSVTVVAELMRRTVSLHQIRQLAVGDMIDLGSLRDVKLRIGGHAALAGEAGEQEGLRCVRISRRIGPQGNQDPDR